MKLKPYLSEKNPYALSKHRYYELKHFCLQYPEWVKMRNSIDISRSSSVVKPNTEHNTDAYDNLADAIDISRRIDLVRKTAEQLDPVMGKWIFIAVTKGIPYTALKTLYDIPCGKDLFYCYVRQFYYMLSQRKEM